MMAKQVRAKRGRKNTNTRVSGQTLRYKKEKESAQVSAAEEIDEEYSYEPVFKEKSIKISVDDGLSEKTADKKIYDDGIPEYLSKSLVSERGAYALADEYPSEKSYDHTEPEPPHIKEEYSNKSLAESERKEDNRDKELQIEDIYEAEAFTDDDRFTVHKKENNRAEEFAARQKTEKEPLREKTSRKSLVEDKDLDKKKKVRSTKKEAVSIEYINRKKLEEEVRISSEVERRLEIERQKLEPKVVISPRITRKSRITVAFSIIAMSILALICIFLGIRYDRLKNELSTLNAELSRYKSLAEAKNESGDDLSGESKDTLSASYKDIRKVYLTFDDGPSRITTEILDILDKYGIKATFFVVGKEDDTSKEIYNRIVKEGHTLAMHSYTHDLDRIYESLDSFSSDLQREQNLLYEVTGVWTSFYRFPGGSSNTASKLDMQIFKDYLERQGITYFDWNVYGGDGIDPEAIAANVSANVADYSTSIVLLHDAADKEETVEALPEIIEYIQGLDNTVILPIDKDTIPIQHGSTR